VEALALALCMGKTSLDDYIFFSFPNFGESNLVASSPVQSLKEWAYQ
jgi:hypothetical protein